MVKVVDEIYEEIKREDFFNRLKKFLPFIGLGIVAILTAAGVYSWYIHHKDTVLQRQEQLYVQALENMSKGYLDQASRQLDELVRSSSDLRSLAMMQKAVIDQERFSLAGQDKKELERTRECYNALLSSHPSIPLKNFMLAVKVMADPSLQSAFPGGNLATSVDSPWHSVELMGKALEAYRTSGSSAVKFFQQWGTSIDLYSESLRWLAKYCFLGVSAESFNKSNNP